MNAPLTQDEINSGWWTVNCCSGRYKGSLTCHCTVCHFTFSGIEGFDRHRRYNKCVDVLTLRDRDGNPVFVSSGRAYWCWSVAKKEASDAESL